MSGYSIAMTQWTPMISMPKISTLVEILLDVSRLDYSTIDIILSFNIRPVSKSYAEMRL